MQGLVERVVVIFFDNENVPIERFVFKVNLNLSYGSKVEEANLEFALRSFLIKLPVSESITKVLPRGKCVLVCSFFCDFNMILGHELFFFISFNVLCLISRRKLGIVHIHSIKGM